MRHRTAHHSSRQPGVIVHARRARQSSIGNRANEESYDILNAFFYGRAFAITLNKRLSEAVIDLVSEVSKSVAERPQRIQEFQDEVAALARKEMSGSNILTDQARGGASGAAGSAPGMAPLPDPQAAIDDLRSEVAYARAILQQIKASKEATAAKL